MNEQEWSVVIIETNKITDKERVGVFNSTELNRTEQQGSEIEKKKKKGNKIKEKKKKKEKEIK